MVATEALKTVVRGAVALRRLHGMFELEGEAASGTASTGGSGRGVSAEKPFITCALVNGLPLV